MQSLSPVVNSQVASSKSKEWWHSFLLTICFLHEHWQEDAVKRLTFQVWFLKHYKEKNVFFSFLFILPCKIAIKRQIWAKADIPIQQTASQKMQLVQLGIFFCPSNWGSYWGQTVALSSFSSESHGDTNATWLSHDTRTHTNGLRLVMSSKHWSRNTRKHSD